MPPDSGNIDAAVIAILSNDAQLKAIMPDGVHWGEAPPNLRKFVIVSLTTSRDTQVFQKRGIDEQLYLIKAVSFGQSRVPVIQAAARIDALLENVSLVAAGFSWMVTERQDRVAYPEVDELDPSIRWQHGGGRYRVQMAIP